MRGGDFLNVIFTCGGTGGHINPALAVANLLRERKPESKILFVGANGGMECRLVPKAGYPIQTLESHSFRRGLAPKAIWHNVMTAYYTAQSLARAKRIIASFRPDVIVGTGGYASYPILKAGSRMGVPTCIHESNAVPGLTTRMVADRVDKILVSFAESKSQYRHPERVEVVGMPVRQEFIYTQPQQARRALGLDDRPLIISAWGSLGAREMNKIMADFFRLERDAGYPFRHIHATGSFGWEWMPDYVKERGVDLSENQSIEMVEYIYDMPKLMAAADLIIGRAGASTLNEIAASGTPCIIVPSPNVTDHHQEKNARVLADRGAAQMIAEKDCTAQVLFDEARRLLEDPARRRAMRRALLDLAVVDSAERIYQAILSLAKK